MAMAIHPMSRILLTDFARLLRFLPKIAKHFKNLRNNTGKLRNEPMKDFAAIIIDYGYSRNVESALLRITEGLRDSVFSNSDIVRLLGCSPNTATGYIKRLRDDLGLIKPVKGLGSGRFAFEKRNEIA